MFYDSLPILRAFVFTETPDSVVYDMFTATVTFHVTRMGRPLLCFSVLIFPINISSQPVLNFVTLFHFLHYSEHHCLMYRAFHYILLPANSLMLLKPNHACVCPASH